MAVEQVRQLTLDVLVFGDVFMDAPTLFAAMLRIAPAQVSQIPSQIPSQMPVKFPVKLTVTSDHIYIIIIN